MAGRIEQQYASKDNAFFKQNYHLFFYALMAIFGLLLVLLAMVSYQIVSRPLPQYTAALPNGQIKKLNPSIEPNLLPETILRWASNAAATSYTFDFVNYNEQINRARPYFTEAGWKDYKQSISGLIATIVQNRIFVYGVVSGTPVISNQGPLPGKGYVWQVQIPFLVTYQAGETSSDRRFIVRLNLIEVSTSISPQGIGIDQFVMVKS